MMLAKPLLKGLLPKVSPIGAMYWPHRGALFKMSHEHCTPNDAPLPPRLEKYRLRTWLSQMSPL